MDFFSLSLFLSVYLYAYLYSNSLFYILLINILIYTIIHIYIGLKHKVSVFSKLAYSFFLDHSLGVILLNMNVDLEKIDEFMKKHPEVTLESIFLKGFGHAYYDSNNAGYLSFGRYIKPK